MFLWVPRCVRGAQVISVILTVVVSLRWLTTTQRDTHTAFTDRAELWRDSADEEGEEVEEEGEQVVGTAAY